MRIQEKSAHRPSNVPRAAVPLGARSMGFYGYSPRSAYERLPADFVQVFWISAGDGVVADRGTEFPIAAEDVFVYLPGRPHKIQAGRKGIAFYWWTMDGPMAAEIVAAFGLTPPRPRYAGPAPVKLFKRLEALMGDVSLAAERKAGGAAYSLLTAASSPGSAPAANGGPSPSVVDRCVQLLRERFATPATGVEAIAREIGIHRSVLTRKFHAEHGIPPIEYLRALRIQRALSLLKETDKPMSEIARMAGFTDPDYFSRAVREATGLSPTRFRRA